LFDFVSFWVRVCLCVELAALEVEGSTLELSKISRLDMGVYLCIASNGVPPAVSKRIHVNVDCESSDTRTALMFAVLFNSPSKSLSPFCCCWVPFLFYIWWCGSRIN